jgi:hypothetical protein
MIENPALAAPAPGRFLPFVSWLSVAHLVVAVLSGFGGVVAQRYLGVLGSSRNSDPVLEVLKDARFASRAGLTGRALRDTIERSNDQHGRPITESELIEFLSQGSDTCQ